MAIKDAPVETFNLWVTRLGQIVTAPGEPDVVGAFAEMKKLLRPMASGNNSPWLRVLPVLLALATDVVDHPDRPVVESVGRLRSLMLSIARQIDVTDAVAAVDATKGVAN